MGFSEMKWRIKRLIMIALTIFLLLVLLAGAIILFFTLSEKKIPMYEVLGIENDTGKKFQEEEGITLLSWNIGYGGLGKEMDFFYEGGKSVRPEKGMFQRDMKGILSFISQQDSMDFIFLQEVDRNAKRSYYTNELQEIGKVLKEHNYSFGLNYDCRFIPIPLTNPMGKVESGIATFSRFTPTLSERIGFGTRFSWPKQLFLLQRCFLVSRFDAGNGRQLIIVNTHNSAFDEKGLLRKTELVRLRAFAVEEYRKGNYVVIGGDWNNNPVGFSTEKISSGDQVKMIRPVIPNDFLSGWRFVYDPERPTNRDVGGPYKKGITPTTVIDFFILSPNIELMEVRTYETGFEFSDHQPVKIRIHLRK